MLRILQVIREKVYLLAIANLLLNAANAQPLQRFEFSEPKMGTTFRIVLYTSGKEKAAAAATAAFDRVDQLNGIFSDYQEDSEVSRLSATAGSGKKVPVSPELWEVLLFSKKLSKKSRGAFDVTIGPLSRLWRRAFRRQEFPEMSKIREARDLVGYQQLRLYKKGRRVKVRKAGMRLDLGGIAKGYTVDEVYRVLQAHGIPRALVDGGGDLYAGDPPPGKAGWEIELMSTGTASGTSSHKKILLTNRAVASSGSTFRFLEWNGRKYSHIIDPRTGLGITETAIINIGAKNGMRADAFASAVSILAERERTIFLDKFRDAARLKGGR